MDRQGDYTISYRRRLPDKGIRNRLMRVPLVKGLVVFFGQPVIALSFVAVLMSDMFRQEGMLGGAVGGNWQTTMMAVSSVLSLVVLAYVFKKMIYRVGVVWKFHGAEHKTIYAISNDVPLELEQVRNCPRVAGRCGTNLVMFLILLLFVFSFLIEYTSVRMLVAFVLAYELFDMENGADLPIIKLFFKLGHWCQEKIFTREPSDVQLQAAIEAGRMLVEFESGLPYERSEPQEIAL